MRREFQLHIGDLALVKLQPYRQHSMVLRKNQKLVMRFFGPFEVMEKIGPFAYKLRLPDTTRIHPIFHISLLKKFEGTHSQQYIPLPLTTIEFGPILSLMEVLQQRVIKRNDADIQ